MSENGKSDNVLKNQINEKKDLNQMESQPKDNLSKNLDQKPIEMKVRNESMNRKPIEDVKRERSDKKNGSSIETSLLEPQPMAAPTLSTSINTRPSLETLTSEEYFQILDNYVSGRHWDLGFEYNLNAFSAVLWSLILTFFVCFEISDKCWEERYAFMSLSLVMSAITAIEVLLVLIVWNSTIVFYFVRRSKFSFIVLSIQLIIGSLNLIIAIVLFATKTCHQLGKLDTSLIHIIPVRYDVKTSAIIHSIIALNVFICTMILAIKRNDFKLYVLWRKGILNDYLMFDDE